jgi:hypothetical protein
MLPCRAQTSPTEDLKQLEKAAEIVARMPFMQEGAEI